MIIAYKNNKFFDRKYVFKRMLPVGLAVRVKRGGRVKVSSVLASGNVAKVKAEINVARILDLGSSDVKSSLRCLNGERILKGDVLAVCSHKIIGLTTLKFPPSPRLWRTSRKAGRFLAPCSGIVDLSAIDSGVLKILDVAQKRTIKMGIAGEVLGVIRNRQVNILCKVLRIRAFLMYGESIQGKLCFLTSQKRRFCRDMGSNADIAVLNFSPDIEFLQKLAGAGVRGVVAGGISYSLFRDLKTLCSLNMTLCILEGFGDIPIEQRFWPILKQNQGYLCLLDMEQQELVLTNTKLRSGISQRSTERFMEKLKIGDRVQIFDEAYWGVYGIVRDIQGEHVKVVDDRRRDILVCANNLLLCLPVLHLSTDK